MRISMFSATVVSVALAGVMVSAQAQRRSQPQTTQFAQNGTYSRADAEVISKRLYRAILGREADTEGLNVTINEVMRANLPAQAQSMFDSSEFKNTQSGKSSSDLLAQFYRGLLDRNPDQSGIDAFMPRMDRRNYVNVIAEMVRSPEFQSKLTGRTSASAPQGALTRIDAALNCQGRVIQAMRNDVNGRVFISFDRMPDVTNDGRTVSGPGVDRFIDHGERPLTYRCDGNNVTYSYGDRRAPTVGDPRINYPSAAVRNCQNAIREGLSFDAAALISSDTNTDYVLGLTGGVIRQCTMDQQRVVSVK